MSFLVVPSRSPTIVCCVALRPTQLLQIALNYYFIALLKEVATCEKLVSLPPGGGEIVW